MVLSLYDCSAISYDHNSKILSNRYFLGINKWHLWTEWSSTIVKCNLVSINWWIEQNTMTPMISFISDDLAMGEGGPWGKCGHLRDFDKHILHGSGKTVCECTLTDTTFVCLR